MGHKQMKAWDGSKQGLRSSSDRTRQPNDGPTFWARGPGRPPAPPDRRLQSDGTLGLTAPDRGAMAHHPDLRTAQATHPPGYLSLPIPSIFRMYFS
jgi:hypothetical protein